MEQVIYLVSYILLVVSGFFYKKTDKEENGFVWLIVTAFSIRLYHGFVYFIFHVAGIGYHMWLIALMDALLSGYLMYVCIYKKERQKYIFLKRDMLTLGIVFTAWLLFVWKFYGFSWSLRFGSVDPALHAQYAKTLVISHQSSTNMYFSSLNTAIWMDLLEPIITRLQLYKVFVFCNGLDWLYTGLMMYALIHRFIKNNVGQSLVTVLLLLYLFAYPLYTTIFGFSYYTASIIVITDILLMVYYYEQERGNLMFTVLLNMALFNLFTSYTLFVPFVFLSLLLAICWRRLSDKDLFTFASIKELLSIFLIPSILGLFLSISNLAELQPGAGISAEGGAYMDLYSNFILFSATCAFGILTSLKQKTDKFEVLLFSMSAIMTVLMFAFSLKGYVSVYYMSKMYNLLWLVFFYFVMKQVSQMAFTKPLEAALPLVPYVICFGIYMAKIDARVVHHVPPYVKAPSSSFLNIYENNYVYYVHWSKMDEKTIAFLQYVEENYADEEKSNIVSIGDEGWSKWSDFFQHGKGRYVHTGNISDIEDKIDKNTQFLCVIKGGPDNNLSAWLEQVGSIVYETEAGYVLELK